MIVLLPSFFFVISPWLFPSIPWLTANVTAHVAWFIACEKLLTAAEHPRPAAAAVPARPDSEPKGFRPLQVLAVFAETPEIRTFRLARPAGFTFKAGQFLMVRVAIDGKPVVRCYSITSAPSVAGYLEISVRKQGRVSELLHSTVKPGTTLDVNGPGGAFVYPPGTNPIVLIAGGIGITPLLCMLRHAVETEPARPVTLILSVKNESQLPFADHLRVLMRRHPQFRAVIALSQGTERQEFVSGRVDAPLIQRAVPNVADAIYLICGPLPMIDAMQALLASLGVPASHIHFEKFEIAQGLAAAATTAADGVRVRLKRHGGSVAVQPGQSMLEALEKAGESIASMCRVGVCGTCRVQLLEGEADGDFTALDGEDRGAGWVLACVARPRTNCVIDA